jgi:hypothetical protein
MESKHLDCMDVLRLALLRRPAVGAVAILLSNCLDQLPYHAIMTVMVKEEGMKL